MFDIKQIVLFKEMLSDRFLGETFRILWPLDLELSSSSQKIKLLLRNERNGFYLVGAVAPEYLFYCTIGSRFKEGKKLEGPGLGNVFSFRVTSQDRNTVLLASNAITEDEYSLSHSYQTNNPDGSPRLVDYGKYCKHQRCLVFNDGVDKIVIPCAVIAATYYFTSISMREQVFAQNLRGLYAFANVDPATREATILMKPGAGDDDIARIARFAIDPHAEKCWDAIMNLIRRDQWIGKNGIKHCPITADIPVVQDLDLKVRGLRTANNRGGNTTVVFEILEENSRYPFERLRPQRHSPGSRTGEEQLFSPSLSKADPKPIVVNTPSSGKYKPVIIRRPAGAANPWEQSLIVEQTEILSTHEQHRRVSR
ncbi:MAG: hypothetical protein FPO08_00010 [Geobacter sp.]|nr:MAG: hypothetical protein FPO08_00010 [Geobacter sp.]